MIENREKAIAFFFQSLDHEYLVEQSEQLGGQARHMYHIWRGDEI